MSRIAIIADIHGNLTALKATLKDIQEHHCDQMICLGDVGGKGIHTNECLDLLRQTCDIMILGNNDEEIINTPLLTDDNNRYLANAHYCHEFVMSGRLIRLFHAGPDTTNNYLGTNPLAGVHERYKMFEPDTLTLSNQVADVVIHGHVHVQTMVKMYNRTLICCGSVGNNLDFIRNPARDGDACHTICATYVILEGTLTSDDAPFDIRFCHVPYDVDEELKATPDDELLIGELKYGRYRHPEKIKKWIPDES